MKKIVFFSHGLSANGIDTFLVNVLKKINREKYDIAVVVAIDEGVECLHEKTVTDLGIRVVHAGDLDAPQKKLIYMLILVFTLLLGLEMIKQIDLITLLPI